MTKKPASFATEAALCAAFMAWLSDQQAPWVPYPETAGWDILLVHGDGTQIGVQAKLQMNIAVLEQAADEWGDCGPDFRAVLVPQRRNTQLAKALGITVVGAEPAFCRRDGRFVGHQFYPSISVESHDWQFCNPLCRHELPRYVPVDVVAGVPSPSPLTKWKIAALEICALLQLRGYVVRDDFIRSGIDFRRWRDMWLRPYIGHPGAWVWREGARRFGDDHPIVFPQVLADIRDSGRVDKGLLL